MKRTSRALPTLQNSRGFSMSELIIAMAISTIVLYGASTVLSSMYGQSLAATDLSGFQEDMNRLEFFINRSFRTAVAVEQLGKNNCPLTLTSATTLPIPTTTYGGCIDLAFDSQAYDAADAGAGLVIALFYRDTGSILGTAGKSNFAATGLYFQTPTKPPGPGSTATYYGVMYLDPGAANPGATAPTANADTFPRITRVTTGAPFLVTSTPGFFVKSFTMNVTMRQPIGTHGGLPLSWCNPNNTATLAVCEPATQPAGVYGAYVDVTRSIQIDLPDNLDTTMTNPADQLMGGRVYLLR